MKKKFLIMIAVITAVISCLWFFLKPAAKDPTLVTLYAAMVQAQSVYDKYTVLYGTGAISKLDFETVENALKEARSAYNASVTAKDLLARQSDYS